MMLFKGRLQENSYLTKNAFDPDHPVIRVEPFDNNELYLLVERVGKSMNQMKI